MKTIPGISIAGAMLVLAAGCALSPVATQQLDQARAAYASAQADPHVKRFASGELQEAGTSLNRAERLAQESAPADAVAHQAYLAEQRARIARELGMARAAQAEVADADEARNRILLEARAREAREARQRAQAEAQSAKEAEAARRAAEQQAQEALEARRAAEQAAERRANQLREQRKETARLEAELREMQAKPTDRGWVITLGDDLLFDSGQSTLKPGAKRGLSRLAGFLKRHPERTVQVEGFTDSQGDEALNQRLSEERARAVRQALVAEGIAADRVSVAGQGEAYPVASNDTAAGRQLNRRVELVVAPGAAASGTGTGGDRAGRAGSGPR